jgi:hypothetical protein
MDQRRTRASTRETDRPEPGSGSPARAFAVDNSWHGPVGSDWVLAYAGTKANADGTAGVGGIGKCQNSGESRVTEGMSPHFHHKKAGKGVHGPRPSLIWERNFPTLCELCLSCSQF